jgi:hypothetical protein
MAMSVFHDNTSPYAIAVMMAADQPVSPDKGNGDIGPPPPELGKKTPVKRKSKAKGNGEGESGAVKAKKAEEPEELKALPDEAQSAPPPPKLAQEDAAAAFLKATSQAQDYTPSAPGALSSVKFDLPDRDVYFRVKPIEEVTLPSGSKQYKNVAIVSTYTVPRGSKQTMSEPNKWAVDPSLVDALRNKEVRLDKCQVRQAVDKQGASYMIPVPVDGWAASGTQEVIRQAETKWIKQWWDPKKGRLWRADDDQSQAPEWPPESFEVLYMLAVKPILIDSKDHEIYKRV